MTPGLQLLTFLLGIYLAELLGHSECEYSPLQGNVNMFSEIILPIYNSGINIEMIWLIPPLLQHLAMSNFLIIFK